MKPERPPCFKLVPFTSLIRMLKLPTVLSYRPPVAAPSGGMATFSLRAFPVFRRGEPPPLEAVVESPRVSQARNGADDRYRTAEAFERRARVLSAVICWAAVAAMVTVSVLLLVLQL